MKETRVKIYLTALAFGCAVISSRAQETNAARTVAELRAQLTAHVEQDRFSGALWGVKVVSLDSGKTIFEHHADRLMSPASNSKLYPAALALDRLGADYKIITPILATTKPDADGVIHGNLVISGRGDPSWNAKHHGTNFWNLISPFVAEIKKAGVRRVTGDLIGDTTFFRTPPSGGSWTVEDLSDSEGAEISALTLNDNLTQLRVTPARKIGEPCEIIFLDPFVGEIVADAAKSGNATVSSLSSPKGGEGRGEEAKASKNFSAPISVAASNPSPLSIAAVAAPRLGGERESAPGRSGALLVIQNHTTTGSGTNRRVEMLRMRGENMLHVFGALPVGGEPEILDVPVPRPAEWFVAALKSALMENGIVVDGVARAVSWPDAPAIGAPSTRSARLENPQQRAEQVLGAPGVLIAQIISPPLRELVKDFMKPSQNLETDLIFDHTGEMLREENSSPWETSEQSAVTALGKFLHTNGLPASDVHFDEGSGLSRNNLTTANATVALLRFMAKRPAAQTWEESLPIAGVDGTIRRRMKNTAAEKNVHAKTGTLRWVNALSGYVTNAAGEKLVFSLMLNRYDSPPGRKRTDELDDIAVMLARSDFRTDESLEKIYAPFGTMIVTQFVSAPFPHPARAQGRTRNGEFFSAAEHYSNSDVALFVPKNFRVTDKIDFVVHFHGWNNTVAGTLEQFNLVQQFCDSGKNAILIIPEGPHNAPDSFGGKLEDTNGFKIFMAEAMEKLQASGVLVEKTDGGRLKTESREVRPPPSVFRPLSIGNIILSGHSGGYHVMAGIVERGGLPIAEAWLFDALYGNVENFVAWQKKSGGRLLDIYTDHGGTKDESEKLMASYKTNGVSFLAEEETNIPSWELMLGNKIVFIHTDLTHNEVIFRRGEFAQFLKTSCLKDK